MGPQTTLVHIKNCIHMTSGSRLVFYCAQKHMYACISTIVIVGNSVKYLNNQIK